MFADKKSTWLFYAFIFLFTLHVTPAVYINSNYLAQFVSPQYVGLVYAAASFCTIIAIVSMRAHLKRFGNYRLFVGSLMVEMLALLLLILSNSIIPAIIAFCALFILQTTVFINMDIFLEQHTPNDSTGKVRGWYFTAINAAFIVGPFLSSIFLSGDDFRQVYIFILILLFPILFMASEIFQGYQDAPYDRFRLRVALRKLKANTDVYATLMSDFILRFFYAWMVIYVPLYLYEEQGFNLSEIALILSIALIPFILIQGLAGRLADDRFGEKEMLTIGFITMAAFTALLSLIDSSNISVWIAILFMTRVGAAMVEIMTETHLFKRIDGGDINIISLSRILRPTAYIAGTLIGTFLLTIISFHMLFFVLGGIVLYGIRYSLAITDTK